MSDQIAIELLRLVPTLIWAGMLVLVLLMFREPIRIHEAYSAILIDN